MWTEELENRLLEEAGPRLSDGCGLTGEAAQVGGGFWGVTGFAKKSRSKVVKFTVNMHNELKQMKNLFLRFLFL